MASAAARAVTSSYAGDVTPADAWSALSQTPHAQLIDVRTPVEYREVHVDARSAVDERDQHRCDIGAANIGGATRCGQIVER